MSDFNSSPPRAHTLELPPSVLHDEPDEPHPDSYEFVQRESQRIAQELSPIEGQSSTTQTTGNHHTLDEPRARSSISVQSRAISERNSYLRERVSGDASQISTAPDSEGPDGYHIRRYRLRRQVPHWYDPVVKFWKTHVSLTIDEGSHRDHLALERTFLGYLRTSLAFAMAGVVIAQLFRLQHTMNPSPTLGFYVLGVPLAAVFICFGVVILLLGAFRFWRQQNAMVRGKIHTGGWDTIVIMGGSILLCLAAFVLVMAVDIDKTYFR